MWGKHYMFSTFNPFSGFTITGYLEPSWRDEEHSHTTLYCHCSSLEPRLFILDFVGKKFFFSKAARQNPEWKAWVWAEALKLYTYENNTRVSTFGEAQSYEFFKVTNEVSLNPRPRPAFSRLQYRQKCRRGPGIFSHVSDIRTERMVEKVFNCVWHNKTQNNTTYHVYLASRGEYYTHKVLSELKNMQNAVGLFYIMFMWKDTRLSPLFHTPSIWIVEREPGNEATHNYEILL